MPTSSRPHAPNAREVRCPCAWRRGACHCSRVMVGARISTWQEKKVTRGTSTRWHSAQGLPAPSPAGWLSQVTSEPHVCYTPLPLSWQLSVQGKYSRSFVPEEEIEVQRWEVTPQGGPAMKWWPPLVSRSRACLQSLLRPFEAAASLRWEVQTLGKPCQLGTVISLLPLFSPV